MFPAYMVVAGAEIGEGKARLARPIDRVSARDLPEFVHEILKLWIAKKSEYFSFAQYVDAEGEKEIRQIADRFRSIPAYSEDASYYRDWGATGTFSLVGRGVGECSAGLFDLIEVDLNSARRIREELRTGDSQNEAALYEITLRSARALLIMRGIEAVTDAAVFTIFAQHLIQAGLIDRRFASVIDSAHRKSIEELVHREDDVFELLKAVEALYRSMDNSLRFPAEAMLTA
jgi:sulfite reductase (ferredoxin)